MGSLFGGTPKVKNVAKKYDSSTVSRPINDTLKSLRNLTPNTFSGGGLSSHLRNGVISINSSGARRSAVNNLSNTFGDLAGEYAGLRSQVRPGFSEFRSARLGENENVFARQRSNLRDDLARRRILGSSFGQDTLTRLAREEAQQADMIQAESFLQELDMTSQFLGQEFEARANQFNTILGEMNLQADLAAKLSGEATSFFRDIANLKSNLASTDSQVRANILGNRLASDTNIAGYNAQLSANEGSGLGELLGYGIGTIFGPAGSALGGKLGSLAEGAF